jgi:hypothetical protein
MSAWSKIKFFYDTMLGSAGSSLTASSTASGDYSPAYIYNMLETNMWKAVDTTNGVWITYDAGAGNAKDADCLAIIGHNLAGMRIYLIGSNVADFSTSYIICNFIQADNKAVLKEFTNTYGAFRYWRLTFFSVGGGALSVIPYVTLAIWGMATELDYASASFDPHAEDVKASVNLSQGGYVTGVHTQYTERSLALKFEDADATLYGKIKTWWNTNGLKNFFVAWENANSPNDVWLMRPDAKFSNPLTNGGLYRAITINLKGRKEN